MNDDEVTRPQALFEKCTGEGIDIAAQLSIGPHLFVAVKGVLDQVRLVRRPLGPFAQYLRNISAHHHELMGMIDRVLQGHGGKLIPCWAALANCANREKAAVFRIFFDGPIPSDEASRSLYSVFAIFQAESWIDV